MNDFTFQKLELQQQFNFQLQYYLFAKLIQNSMFDNHQGESKQQHQKISINYLNSYSDCQNSDDDYELIPRQLQIRKIQKQNPVICLSRPYKKDLEAGVKINLIQHSSIESAQDYNSQGIDTNNINQLEINQSIISKSSSQQNKNIEFPIDQQFQLKLQELNNIALQNRQSQIRKFNQNINNIHHEHQQNYRFSFGTGPAKNTFGTHENSGNKQFVKIQNFEFQSTQTLKKKQISNLNDHNINSSNRKKTISSNQVHFIQQVQNFSGQKRENQSSHISIEKHQGYQKSKYQKLVEENRKFNEQLIQSKQQLEFNKFKVEQLREQLIKSSQKNINAIFNTQIHEDVCLIHKVQKIKTQVQSIKNKFEAFSQYPHVYQVNSLHNCPDHRQNCFKQDQFYQIQAKNKNLSKKYFQLADYIQNVQQNQAKFSKQLQKLKNQFQRNIMQKVQNLLNLRLIQQNNKRQIRQIQHYQEFQYNPIVKAQTLREDDEYDDSRGSISVIYIQRLRQFQNLVFQKENTIIQLKQQNQFLKKYLNKLESIRFQERKKEVIKNVEQNKNKQELQSALFRKKNNILDISQSISIQEQKIKENAIGKNQQGPIDFVNKKKNTHSFHQRKNIRQKLFQQLQQKLKNYELIIKEKDFRIKELENTIMDHLQKDNFKPNKKLQYSFNSISADSKQQNTEILQSKVHNLKTLLAQTKKQNKKLKLELQQAYIYSKSTKESQVTKSMCRSQKNNVNIGKNYQTERQLNPFQQLQAQYKKNQAYGQEINLHESNASNSSKKSILPFINDALNLIQSLKQIAFSFCRQQIQAQKIQYSIKTLFTNLRISDESIYQKVKSMNTLCRQFS